MFICNIWTIPAIFTKGDNPGQYNPGQYDVKISDVLFGFHLPYLSQKLFDIQDPVFTLVVADLGHAYNWVVCRAIDRRQWVETADIDPLGVAEFTVLKKVGVMRTDSSSELLVRGLLQKMDCLFV